MESLRKFENDCFRVIYRNHGVKMTRHISSRLASIARS
jgi:hypothetical protein